MNKLKPGDKVQLTAKTHSWYTEHIVESYQVRGEFQKENYREIAMLLESKAKRVKLKGIVLDYGAEDDLFDDKRKNVYVEFYYKDMCLNSYFSEKDLKKL